MLRSTLFLILFFSLMSMAIVEKQKPVVYIIGDSTVKNGSGRGEGGLWGWGDFLYEQIDTSKISIVNKARGGRSTRSYISEGLWDQVLNRIKPGDFVLIQFGHNDTSPINDSTRARGTIKGTGDEVEEIDNMLNGKHETVQSYGWYLRKYIADIKQKKATPIICSPVVRNNWKDNKVVRATDDYSKWAAESAKTGGAFYIDLNEITATHYEKLGEPYVNEKLFITDHTHTSKEGAQINALCVREGIDNISKCKLKKYTVKK